MSFFFFKKKKKKEKDKIRVPIKDARPHEAKERVKIRVAKNSKKL
jgi:hypothetical protein